MDYIQFIYDKRFPSTNFSEDSKDKRSKQWKYFQSTNLLLNDNIKNNIKDLIFKITLCLISARIPYDSEVTPLS